MIVVDASLVVKWFLDEPLSVEAEEILKIYTGQMIAPDILIIEVTSALVRNANMVKSSRPNVLFALDRFERLLADGDLISHRSSGTAIRQSANLALDLGHPLKDCVYLALAMELDCELVTCDVKFAEKARSTSAKVRVLDK